MRRRLGRRRCLITAGALGPSPSDSVHLLTETKRREATCTGGRRRIALERGEDEAFEELGEGEAEGRAAHVMATRRHRVEARFRCLGRRVQHSGSDRRVWGAVGRSRCRPPAVGESGGHLRRRRRAAGAGQLFAPLVDEREDLARRRRQDLIACFADDTRITQEHAPTRVFEPVHLHGALLRLNLGIVQIRVEELLEVLLEQRAEVFE